MIRPNEEKKLQELTAQIEAGAYCVPGEEIARAIFNRHSLTVQDDFVERTLREHGGLSIGVKPLPEPKTEPVPLSLMFYDTRVCREHRIEYHLRTGQQEFDCPECRARTEMQEAARWNARFKGADDFRQEGGMAQDGGQRRDWEEFGWDRPLNEEPERERGNALIPVVASALLITVCIILCAAIVQAWGTP